ncbi:MAG: hypothetical protein ACYTHJ_11450 [Planctomycetota bacterium]|jgi:hypothetical protein
MNLVMNTLVVALIFGMAGAMSGPLTVMITKPRTSWTFKTFAAAAKFYALAAAIVGAMLSIVCEAGGPH